MSVEREASTHGPRDVVADTAAAFDAEHSISFREALSVYRSAVFWAIGMSMTIVMEGYDTSLVGSLFGYPAFVKTYGDYYPELDETFISGPWQAGLGNASLCGCVIGLLINGYVTERWGHRRVTMVGLVALTGLLFVVFFAPSIEVLTVGQVLCGIPLGIFAIMGPTYSSEICPLALRGYLTSYVNICWVIGQFIAAGVLQGLVGNMSTWAFRIPFALQWIWPVPLFLIAYYAPDSPWWLVRRGRLEDAEASLQRLGPGLTPLQVKEQLGLIVHTNDFEAAVRTESSYWDCFKGANLIRTEISCMALCAQTLPGSVMCYNASFFFIQAGLSPDEAYKLNFGSLALALVATCISWLLMSRLGRRTLIVTGLAMLTVDLLLIGAIAFVDTRASQWAQSALAVVWLAVYSATVGPETFCLAAEVSATRLRAQTVSVARNAYNAVLIVNLVVQPYLINPTEADLRGKAAFYWFGLSFLTTIWAVLRLPETKDRSYEELDVLFEKRTKAWRFASTKVDIIAEAEMVQMDDKLRGDDDM